MQQEERLAGGRYVVRGVLGEGAQGLTYDAVDSRDGRAVAIKRFNVRDAKSWKDVELAEREARVLSTLDHPLVPRYLEHFEDDGALYVVMEKIEGETLEAHRRRGGAIAEDEVWRFLACADRALTYLHGRASPVVHRDIKPRNVVRRPDGSYVLVDFGTVSELLLRRGNASTIAGTFGYMAPEQLQGRAFPTTDVYAVGATALAALTGVDPEDLPHRGLRVDARAALEGRASPAMIEALERMLEPDPDRRPTSVGPVLDSVRAGLVVAPRPTAVVPRSNEDAAVKSIRSLLWVLWAIGWVLVPLLVRGSGHHQLIPIIMFGWLALLLIASWHKGALIRIAWRTAVASLPPEARAAPEAAAQQHPKRVEAPRLRVHATALRPEEMTGETELDRRAEPAAARRR